MIISHQTNIAAFAGNHRFIAMPQQIIVTRIVAETPAGGGALVHSLAGDGGLAGKGGLAGDSGGLAG